MFTNRLLNLIVATVFVVVIALAVQRAFAAKAIVPETNRAYTESNEWALRAASSLVEEDIASLSYLSRLNQCFDVPFSKLASCRNASQAPAREIAGTNQDICARRDAFHISEKFPIQQALVRPAPEITWCGP
jgi:hypothetical protein